MFLLSNANDDFPPPPLCNDILCLVPGRSARAFDCCDPLGRSSVGSHGSLFYAGGIFRNGSRSFHYRFSGLDRCARNIITSKKVLAVMRNFLTNYRAGCAFGEANGCVDTPAGLFDHAGLFFLSCAHNTRDRDIFSPAQIENERLRSVVAWNVGPVVARPVKLLTISRDSVVVRGCELRFTMPYWFHVPFTHCGVEGRQSVQLLFRILVRGYWTARCIILRRQNMRKWTQDIWSSTFLSGLHFLRSLCEQKGFGRYA